MLHHLYIWIFSFKICFIGSKLLKIRGKSAHVEPTNAFFGTF